MSRFTVNKEAVSKVLEYIQDSSEYTFENFLKKINRWNSVDLSGTNIKMSCIFHDDKKPSLYLDEDRKLWKCFSCERGGKYVDMLVHYGKIVEGSSAGFYQVLNDLLSKDAKMQLSLGYSTIYTINEVKLNIPEFSRRKFRPSRVSTIDSLLELSRVMKKENLLDFGIIRLAILYANEGYSPSDIYKMIKDGVVTDPTETGNLPKMSSFGNIDINKIMEGISFGEGE